MFYGIKIVSYDDWKKDDALRFSEQERDKWGNEIDEGSRILIYDRVADDALVGEVEVIGDFIPFEGDSPDAEETDPAMPLTGHFVDMPESKQTVGEMADVAYLLPVKVIEQGQHVPQATVRETMDVTEFPLFDESLTPLDEDTYNKLRENWN